MLYHQSHALRVRLSLRKKTRPDPIKPGRRVFTNYQVVAYDPLRTPTRRARSLGTKNRRLAYRLFLEAEERYRTGLEDFWTPGSMVLPVGAPSSCAAAVEAYLADAKQPNDHGVVRQESTVRQYGFAVRGFAEWMEANTFVGVPVSDVREQHVKDFAFASDLSDHTKGTRLKRVRDFLAWCVKKRYILTNPTNELKPPRVGGKTAHFQASQLNGFLDFLKEQAEKQPCGAAGLLALRRAIVLGTDVGLRVGEICALRWRDVDLEGRLIRVESSSVHRTKNGRSRVVPITGRVLQMLTILKASAPPGADFVLMGRGGRRLKQHTVSITFRRNADRHGLPEELTFHSTRHTYGTDLSRGDVPESKRQLVLGHATAQMTQLYNHACGADAREDIDRVFGNRTWEE